VQIGGQVVDLLEPLLEEAGGLVEDLSLRTDLLASNFFIVAPALFRDWMALSKSSRSLGFHFE
jgi:hypothetical protein